MTNEKYSKPTKELILDAAFSFLEEPRYNMFSMNELAERVGITKPAIYRHFKGKEEVLSAMEKRLFDDLAEYLSKINASDAASSKIPLANLIHYFLQNPNYINYFIAQMSSVQNYEEKVFNELQSRNVPVFLRTQTISTNVTEFAKHVFSGMTIFYFVKVQEKFIKMGLVQKVPENFALQIVELMIEGIAKLGPENPDFLIEKLSEQRKNELLQLCKISPEIFPKENKIFTALASVIEKYKFPGVTVERIAEELNMAKSSLYEYFDNKNQMVKTLINRELQLLQTIIIENSAEAKNFTEYVYILIASEIEYFNHRPSIIPICGWLLMGSADDFEKAAKDAEKNEGCGNSPWEKRLPRTIRVKGLEFPCPVEVITDWIKCLPIAFFVESKGKKFTQEQSMECFMQIIDYILFGIK
ncbi:TetR/AcrR family transcriptional regulator [Treponema sp.]|uniref:TetR/AcrR family transcriptional regulator n=1 Tax=Treponema sp. TaxID=166 RepID=UPI003890D291